MSPHFQRQGGEVVIVRMTRKGKERCWGRKGNKALIQKDNKESHSYYLCHIINDQENKFNRIQRTRRGSGRNSKDLP